MTGATPQHTRPFQRSIGSICSKAGTDGGDCPKLVAAGLVLGLAVAFAGSRVLASMLYGVAPHDPITFAGIALLMPAVAMLASYLPARRAMGGDTVVA